MVTPIQSLEATYLAHATEDRDKIQKSLEWVIGFTCNPELEQLEGHFGNVIVKGKILITGESAWKAFRNIFSKMSPDLVKEIGDNITQYLDEHSSLFMRFDKQALVSGSVALGSADPIRIKIKPRSYLAKGRGTWYFRELIKRP